MTKHLRLAVGELTDVGRRRERNQDNVIHFVPDEEDLLARRGALFVVCDGMGGHAAGEIASDMAVRTIRDEYFQDTDEDTITALSRAIRSANTAIYEHARTHASHTGMGTTCVALVLVGGRAFIANIGDSRAYILREGALRQVTLDHSWVAEQVRAGILTADQARTHTHRNVITRSLGTQSEVLADLFIETMREGDRVLLCSDGLHGYVPEPEIQRVVVEQAPDVGVRRLIDMANANGGPDNVTAVVVHLLEVPVVTDELALPEAVTVTRVPEAATVGAAARGGRTAAHGGEAGRAAFAGAPPDAYAAGVAARPARAPAQESRLALWPSVALRALAVAALCLLSLGIWDVLAGPYAASSAASARAQQDIAYAHTAALTAAAQDPSMALATISTAQRRLQQDLATLPLDSQGQQAVRQALNSIVAPAVRTALQAYDEQGLITPLPTTAVASFTVTCGAATLIAAPNSLAVVGPAHPQQVGEAVPSTTVYARADQGALYQMDLAGTTATCATAPAIAQGVTALATDQTQLYALTQQSTAWVVLAVSAGAKPTTKLTLPADQAHMPIALAARGGDFYVAFQNVKDGTGGIWHFGGSSLAKPAQTMPTDAPVASLSVAASGALFALLPDGSLVQWDKSGHMVTVPVALFSPVPPADPNAYLAATPVPSVPPTTSAAPATATPTPEQASGSLASGTATVPPVGTKTTTAASPTPTATPTPVGNGPPALFTGATSLVADRGTPAALVVGDSGASRVVRFTVSGPTLELARQYVYGPPLASLQSVTVSADGTRVFAWNGQQLVEVTLPV